MKRILVGVAVAFIALSVLGGYGLHWKWTGFSANGTVWDWLNLCLLPVTLAMVPLAFETSTRVLQWIVVGSIIPMTVLLVGGYGYDWAWTGFAGNTLWNWLHLLLVPVALPFFAHELGERVKHRRESTESPDKAEAGAATRAEAGGSSDRRTTSASPT